MNEGGGGYVSGLLVHPTSPSLLYARCDVGGVYRFDFSLLSWLPLLVILSSHHPTLCIFLFFFIYFFR